jgi:hypothetical protein
MASKRGPKDMDFDSDPFDDLEDFDDDLDNIGNLSKDFYSTDWEDPNDSDYRYGNRRKSGRRKEHKGHYSDFDDGDELDFGNEW